jgi:hypothetical protein
MNKKHEQLRQAVLDALEEFTSDMSVSQSVTLEGLEEFQSQIESSIEAIRGDLKREGKT